MAINILLVDDERDLVEVTKMRLESRGFTVTCAYDGLSAIEKIKNAKPDVVLLDLFMPIMNGYELSKKFKQDPDVKDIPIIFFSAGNCKNECTKEAKSAGGVDFVSKPFDVDELIDKIKFYTKKSNG